MAASDATLEGMGFLANGIGEAANDTYGRGNVVVRQPKLTFARNLLPFVRRDVKIVASGFPPGG